MGFSNGSCHHVEDLKCVPGLITSICKINQQMEVLSLPFKINKQEKKKDTSKKKQTNIFSEEKKKVGERQREKKKKAEIL